MSYNSNIHSIAIQGINGSFHHEAATLFFHDKLNLIECMTFRELVGKVTSGKAAHGIMAVENSLAGGMLPNLSLIRESDLFVSGELYMRISQNLMALPGQDIYSLTEVHSHPLAIMQSEAFFNRFPHIRLIESADTALSAKDIADNQRWGVGAIGSDVAARLYGLDILAPSIETNKENYTRFLVIGKQPSVVRPEEKVKASVAFVIPHTPGSLYEAMKPLAEAGVNLTMLQSLPLVGQKWQYIFHADMIFQNMAAATTVIEAFRTVLKQLWVMGIYPLQNRSGSSTAPRQTSYEKIHGARPAVAVHNMPETQSVKGNNTNR